MVKEVIFYCKGCKYWRRTGKEQYGKCTMKRLTLVAGICYELDETPSWEQTQNGKTTIETNTKMPKM